MLQLLIKKVRCGPRRCPSCRVNKFRFVTCANPRLLLQGFNLEGQNDKGMTPLMSAVLQGRLQQVETLLEKNANMATKDHVGPTYFDLCCILYLFFAKYFFTFIFMISIIASVCYLSPPEREDGHALCCCLWIRDVSLISILFLLLTLSTIFLFSFC